MIFTVFMGFEGCGVYEHAIRTTPHSVVLTLKEHPSPLGNLPTVDRLSPFLGHQITNIPETTERACFGGRDDGHGEGFSPQFSSDEGGEKRGGH